MEVNKFCVLAEPKQIVDGCLCQSKPSPGLDFRGVEHQSKLHHSVFN